MNNNSKQTLKREFEQLIAKTGIGVDLILVLGASIKKKDAII